MELVVERWALLIVRDLLVGPRRYGELAAGLHRIPSNILAARLKELQAAGVIRRAPRSRVIVYELTPYGRELEPVVLALGAWGFKAMDEPREEQLITAESMTMDLRSAFRPRTALELPTTSYAGRFGAVRGGRPAHPGRWGRTRRDAGRRRVRGWTPWGGAGRSRLRGGPGHPAADHGRARGRPRHRDRRGRGAGWSRRAAPPLREHVPRGGMTHAPGAAATSPARSAWRHDPQHPGRRPRRAVEQGGPSVAR